MKETTFKTYFGLVNNDHIQEASQYYSDDMYLLDDGYHYNKAQILKLLGLLKTYYKLDYNLLHYFTRSDDKALAAEVKVVHKALVDVPEQPFVEAGFPEAYIPLKKGEVHESEHVYIYSYEGNTLTSSIGYAK